MAVGKLIMQLYVQQFEANELIAKYLITQTAHNLLLSTIHRGNLLATVAHLMADLLSGVVVDLPLLWRELLGSRTTARGARPAGQLLVALLSV